LLSSLYLLVCFFWYQLVTILHFWVEN